VASVELRGLKKCYGVLAVVDDISLTIEHGGLVWTTARRVTIPLAPPALVAGALVAFLQAMTLFDLNESGDLGAISVLGLIMLAITFAVVIAVNRIPGFGEARLRNA